MDLVSEDMIRVVTDFQKENKPVTSMKSEELLYSIRVIVYLLLQIFTGGKKQTNTYRINPLQNYRNKN
jgi:hypothetical protein